MSQKAQKFKRNCNYWKNIHKFDLFQYVANYYFDLLQASCLLQNVCTSNFRNLTILSSSSLFWRHWVSSFFFIYSIHLDGNISSIHVLPHYMSSVLLWWVWQSCRQDSRSETATRMIITLHYDTTADEVDWYPTLFCALYKNRRWCSEQTINIKVVQNSLV